MLTGSTITTHRVRYDQWALQMRGDDDIPRGVQLSGDTPETTEAATDAPGAINAVTGEVMQPRDLPGLDDLRDLTTTSDPTEDTSGQSTEVEGQSTEAENSASVEAAGSTDTVADPTTISKVGDMEPKSPLVPPRTEPPVPEAVQAAPASVMSTPGSPVTPADSAPAQVTEPVTASVDTPTDVDDQDKEPVIDRPRRDLPRVMAVANQKGGVGKTTSTVNIGACLAELGFRTLIVDMDPQANATTGVGIDPRSISHSLYDVIVQQQPIDDCIEPTAVKNLFLVPSGVELAGAEIELVPMMSREHRLRQAIESVLDDYDYVLIDCPPSLGLLTVNALTAAREVLVPIQCEYYALEGLGQLLRNVDLVKANLNPNLDITTIVLVMYDARTKLAGQVVDEVRAHFAERVCREVIPRTVRLSEAPSYGQPITVFDSSSRGAEAYRAVTKEISGVTT